MSDVKPMVFPECSTQDNIKQTRCPCLCSWIKPWMFHWLDMCHHLSQSCLVSLYRGHLSILNVHVLSVFFYQVRSAARKRWHRWQDHHSLRVRVARAMSIPTSPTRISFHSIKQTAAVWYALHSHAPRGGLQGSSFFTLPERLSSNFVPLFCTALFLNEVPIIFLWTLISHIRDAALRQPGKSSLSRRGETDSKKKEIERWLHLVEVHNTKSKTAHWQEQSIFFSFLFFFPFCIVVNKDYF